MGNCCGIRQSRERQTKPDNKPDIANYDQNRQLKNIQQNKNKPSIQNQSQQNKKIYTIKHNQIHIQYDQNNRQSTLNKQLKYSQKKYIDQNPTQIKVSNIQSQNFQFSQSIIKKQQKIPSQINQTNTKKLPHHQYKSHSAVQNSQPKRNNLSKTSYNFNNIQQKQPGQEQQFYQQRQDKSVKQNLKQNYLSKNKESHISNKTIQLNPQPLSSQNTNYQNYQKEVKYEKDQPKQLPDDINLDFTINNFVNINALRVQI